MANMMLNVCFSVVLLLQVYPAELVDWPTTQTWSLKSEHDCVKYYANMTILEGSWCTTMWDGVLCWPPSPIGAVAFLPCPPSQEGNGKTRTAQKRCSPEGRWEDFKDQSTFLESEDGPSQQTHHPCLAPQDAHHMDESSQSGAITSYQVNSRIEQRYAQTTVKATVINADTQPSDLKFKMTLPKTAFISSLVMEIDGANYTSTVRSKPIASRSYQVAKKDDKDAALVEQSDMQEFEVSANIVSRQVTFYIKYEELLRRVNGKYIQKIYIRPGSRIPEAEVNVHIVEQDPIRDLRILELPGQEHLTNRGATVSEEFRDDGDIKVMYKHMAPLDGGSKGVDGTFTIAYNLGNHASGGKIQRVGNYFSHFLSLDANDRLPKIATHTVFALDVSNSMGGGKLSQMKAALKDIIKSMSDDDSFEILAFSSDVVSLGVFNGTYYRKALRRVKKLQPMSYSNLNEAYLRALKSTDEFTGITPLAKQIVMITDGEPTQGILDPLVIRRNVLEANRNGILIFGIGFGPLVHFNLIQQISSDSGASARHLHVKRNLARDLKEFYREISKPILTNLTISYPENEVDPASVVKIANSNFYSGGEVVAAGMVYPGVRNIHPWVMGVGQVGPMQMQMDGMENIDGPWTHIQEEDSAVVRLWAYLKVQHLLKQAEINDNYVQVKTLMDQATQLALKFRFVTHVTSLVVRDATGEYEADFLERDSVHLPLPQSPASLTFQPYDPKGYHQADQPQPPRNPRYQPQTQGYDLDPHFIVHSPSMSIALCFDFHANDGAYINIIRDLASGIIVNGQTMSSVQNPKLTYITKLFLAFGKVNITLTPDHMEVDCVDEDGNMEVDRVTKSLWPFYKKNGKKNRKRMSSRGGSRRKQPKASPGHDTSKGSLRGQVGLPEEEDPRTHEYDTPSGGEGSQDAQPMDFLSQQGLKAYRVEEEKSSPEEGQMQPVNYVMNSVADDYLPHHSSERLPRNHMRRRLAQHARRTARQSDAHGRPVDDYGYCNFNSTWEEGVGKKYGDVMIVLTKKRSLHIRVGDGDAHFVIVRSNKGSQKFLGFYIENEKILSADVHGLIGQFTSKNITTAPSLPGSTPGDNATVELLVKRRNRRGRYRTTRVSGYYSRRRSLHQQEYVECIQTRRQGKGLLDGTPKDYILSCLQC